MIRKQEITTFEFPEDSIIWDVRDASAYAEAHVKGAVNQPITALSSEALTRSVNGSTHLHFMWWWK